MGIQRVPCDLTKSQISQSLIRRDGRITYAARDLNVCYRTLKAKIDEDEELTELIRELRSQYDTILMDAAESVLAYAMSQASTDLPNAIKCATYVLNKKGYSRGYLHSVKGEPVGFIDIRGIAGIAEKGDQRISSSSEPFEPTVEIEQPILDQDIQGSENQVSDELGTGDPMEGDALL